MPIKSPKAKGSAGEHEVIKLLTGWASEIGVKLDLTRNLEQVRSGGADIDGVPGLEIEVKRVEANGINQWWAQVCKAADRSGKRPFLIHRKNRQPWSIRVGIYAAEYPSGGFGGQVDRLVVDLTADQGKKWFHLYLRQRVKEGSLCTTTTTDTT